MLKAAAFIGTLMALSAEAQIITTSKIEDIKAALKQADNETLVIFDCDDVLIEACDDILKAAHGKELGKLISDCLHRAESTEHLRENMYTHYYDIVLCSAKRKLLNPEWPTLIEDLQRRGVKVLLLSSCLVGRLEETESIPPKRYEELYYLGIDFHESWDCAEKIVIPGLKSGSSPGQKCAVFYKGMLLCPPGTKGEVLEVFLQKDPTYKFKKIIFIDDRIENIKDVRRMAYKIGVRSFVGIEYTYARVKPHPPLDLQRAKKQIDILVHNERWVQDEKIPPDNFEEILQQILQSHYPKATVKNYTPQYADKYSYQGGGFYELNIPGSDPKIIKICSREEVTNSRAFMEYLEKHQLLSIVKQYLILPEFICDEPPCFYVMDKAPGEDFDAFNARFYKSGVDKETYLQVHRSLGQIFAFLHNYGIFHWDPHASNVFVLDKRISIIDNDEICVEAQDRNEKKHMHDFKTLVLKTTPFSAYVISKYRPDRTQKGLTDFPLPLHAPFEDLFEAVSAFIQAYFQGTHLPSEKKPLFIHAVMSEVEKYVGVLPPSALAAIEHELLSCLL